MELGRVRLSHSTYDPSKGARKSVCGYKPSVKRSLIIDYEKKKVF